MPRRGGGHPARKIGDLYTSFLAADDIEALGTTAIKAALAQVDEVTDIAGLIRLLGARDRTGGSGAFAMYVDTDPADPERYLITSTRAVSAFQTSPTTATSTFPRSATTYVAHFVTMLGLAGVDGAAPGRRGHGARDQDRRGPLGPDRAP